jgi:DNA-binding GntR family transcriptional regulator
MCGLPGASTRLAAEYIIYYTGDMPPPGARRPIRADLRAVLRDRILDGSLPPGAPVRAADVARDLRVSATPAREAMIELARDGLLSVDPNRGFFVSAISSREIQDLYPLIALLEVNALREAPPPPSTLEELDRINGRFGAARDPGARQSLDMEWHELLVSSCVNVTLLGILDELRVRVRRYELAYLRDTRRAPQSAKQHAEIVAALRQGELSRAATLLDRNWRQGLDVLVPWAERREVAP